MFLYTYWMDMKGDRDGNYWGNAFRPAKQPTIERDLRFFVPDRLDLPDDALRWQCEQAIRNYDPCMSCATHALPGQMPLEVVIRDAEGNELERLSQFV